jgi:hypothetical protein
VHGWSPECCRGVHGIGSCTKQWQLRFWQPGGQLHSEQRIRHPVRSEVWQQNHSPEVRHSGPQPPPSTQVLHGKPALVQLGAVSGCVGCGGGPCNPCVGIGPVFRQVPENYTGHAFGSP